MARAALWHKTSVWASWLLHWPTCMCVNSREKSSLEAGSTREKKGGGGGGGGGETLPQQEKSDLAAAQQDRCSIRIHVYSVTSGRS